MFRELVPFRVNATLYSILITKKKTDVSLSIRPYMDRCIGKRNLHF